MGTGRGSKGERHPLVIKFRGSKLDARRLDALARLDELTGADVLRRLLREECDRRGVKP